MINKFTRSATVKTLFIILMVGVVMAPAVFGIWLAEQLASDKRTADDLGLLFFFVGLLIGVAVVDDILNFINNKGKE